MILIVILVMVFQRKMRIHTCFFFELECPYGDVCKTKLSFLGSGAGDTLDGRCFSEYVLNLITNDSSILAHSGKRYPISLTPESHAKFSLIDEDNIEKKYDIDLSGITRSYTVRGDSVDVNVMKGCSLSLYECDRETVYGNLILDSRYSFSILEGCKKYYSYDCLWDNQGPLKKDNLDIHAKIYWKE